MTSEDRTDRYCVIGAGVCGLLAAKNLLQHGFEVDVLERERELGGVWNFDSPGGKVYRSTRMISSKNCTQIPDFPMPKEFSHYPHHTQVLEYFRAYAEHFELPSRMEFETGVQDVQPVDDGRQWDVTVSGPTGQSVRRYRGVVIANGHHRTPIIPQYPGEFSGQVLHSSQYKSHEVLSGRRVLVVGAGNSGCDIAVEAAQHAQAAFLSMRRGYHYIPKFFFGIPADKAGERLLRWRLPLWLRRLVIRILLRMTVGPVRRYGLPRPDHKLFETHPIINSLLTYYTAHRAVNVKPDIQRLSGNLVEFVDGSSLEIDCIVYATGYQVDFPFIERSLLNYHDGWPRLFQHAFHPQYDNLMVAGMIQPDGGLWPSAHWQTTVMARFLAAAEAGHPAAERFRRLKATAQVHRPGNLRYQSSPRHHLEVEHWSYLRELEKLGRQLEIPGTATVPTPRPAKSPTRSDLQRQRAS